VCEVVISLDIDLIFGFVERVTDASPGLGSRSGKDGSCTLIDRTVSNDNEIRYFCPYRSE